MILNDQNRSKKLAYFPLLLACSARSKPPYCFDYYNCACAIHPRSVTQSSPLVLWFLIIFFLRDFYPLASNRSRLLLTCVFASWTQNFIAGRNVQHIGSIHCVHSDATKKWVSMTTFDKLQAYKQLGLKNPVTFPTLSSAFTTQKTENINPKSCNWLLIVSDVRETHGTSDMSDSDITKQLTAYSHHLFSALCYCFYPSPSILIIALNKLFFRCYYKGDFQSSCICFIFLFVFNFSENIWAYL